jgi:hypothetical protein
MAKISNKDKYPLSNNPSLSDFIVGTVFGTNKTKNFNLQALLSLLNASNGFSNVQYKFSLDETIHEDETGFLTTNGSQVSPSTINLLRFSTLDLNEVDLTDLLTIFNSNRTSVLIKLFDPSDPNLIIIFKVTGIDLSNLDYIDLSVSAYKSMSNGDFVDEKIYGFEYFIFENTGASSIDARYDDIPDLLANQGSQADFNLYYVEDASLDPTVTSGFAYYEYLGTTLGTLADYRKLSEEEVAEEVSVTNTSQLINDGEDTVNPFYSLVNSNKDDVNWTTDDLRVFGKFNTGLAIGTGIQMSSGVIEAINNNTLIPQPLSLSGIGVALYHNTTNTSADKKLETKITGIDIFQNLDVDGEITAALGQTVFHSGNANKSSVNWVADELLIASGLTGSNLALPNDNNIITLLTNEIVLGNLLTNTSIKGLSFTYEDGSGINTIFHAGNSNKSDVNWAADILSANNVTSENQATLNSHLVRLDQMNSAIGGLSWQHSIISQLNFTTSEPVSPSDGDRYINNTTGLGSVSTSITFTINRIYEWSSQGAGSWLEFIPQEGWTLWDESLDTNYTFNGTDWVEFGSTVSHNNTLGLQGGTASEYYHLTAAQYAANAYTNVNNNFSTDQTITGDLTINSGILNGVGAFFSATLAALNLTASTSISSSGTISATLGITANGGSQVWDASNLNGAAFDFAAKDVVANGNINISNASFKKLILDRDTATGSHTIEFMNNSINSWQILGDETSFFIRNLISGGVNLIPFSLDFSTGDATFSGEVNTPKIGIGVGAFSNQINATGDTNLLFNSNGGELFFNNDVADDLQFNGGGGNAIFSGEVRAMNLALGQISSEINTHDSALHINVRNADGSSTDFRDFSIRDGKFNDVMRITGSDKATVFSGKVTSQNLNLTTLPVFADDTAAASLSQGDIYRTVTGELRIKL